MLVNISKQPPWFQSIFFGLQTSGVGWYLALLNGLLLFSSKSKCCSLFLSSRILQGDGNPLIVRIGHVSVLVKNHRQYPFLKDKNLSRTPRSKSFFFKHYIFLKTLIMKITVMHPKSPRTKSKEVEQWSSAPQPFSGSRARPYGEKHLVPKYGSLVLGTSVTYENPHCTACNSHKGKSH